MVFPARSASRAKVGVATAFPASPKYARREPRRADAGGWRPPRSIRSSGGFFRTPLTVARRLTISAASSGACVP